MKVKRVETPEKYMLDLNWDRKDLEKAKEMLWKWDRRPNRFYDNRPKYVMKADIIEREHLRNSINFWSELFNHENKSS